MTVRAFGGFDFSSDDAYSNNFTRIGYQKGVPMGGDLSAAPKGKKFSMMIAASKDPDGANLDRIQVIKGWVDSKGKQYERIYDAAVSGGRKTGKDGRCKTPVGSTVDLKTATYKNTIGEAMLVSTWVDPDFDPAVSSFYYVRVLEIPTPRWTAFDALRYAIVMPEEVTMVLQERAYTSPIWYTPKK
jgi:hypothetical protein